MTTRGVASTVVAVACAWLSGIVAAQAQTSFRDIRLAVGDRVEVTLLSRDTVKGEVAVVLPGTISVNGRDLSPPEVRRIDRVGDSLWNGAAIGFAVGAVVGQDRQLGCFNSGSSSRIRCAVLPGLAYGAIGMLIDRAREKRNTVFGGLNVTLVPVVGGTFGAVVLRVTY